MQSIQAIETHYNGYRFRSRLEARWAVFFDAVNEPYSYEIEGIEGNGLRYLPDFWLPRWGNFIEVKGHMDIQDGRKLVMLVNQTGTDHLVVKDIGDIMFSIGPNGPRAKRWAECPLCHGLAIIDYCDCEGCTTDVFWYLDCAICSTNKRIKVKRKAGDPSQSKKLLSAYTAARSARFEHGETPKVKRGRQNR